MRKVVFAVVALVALMLTSLAVAEGIGGAKSAKSVAATFSAAAGATTTRTCTTSDGKTIVITDGKYTGTAAGDPDLTGAITLRARSVVNTTDKIGVVEGRFSIDVANGKSSAGTYSSVYDNGSIAGLAVGKAHQPNGKLIANLSATFAAATGFTNGKLGGDASGGSAVELGAGGCRPAKATPEKSEAHGTVSALSSDSITVAGLTCAVPADKSADVNAKLRSGDVAQIRCALVSGTSTLVSFAGKKKH